MDKLTLDITTNQTTTVGMSESEIENLTNLSELEIKLERIRFLRDEKLAETDWWASSDLTMTSEQTAYRKALRDITEGVTIDTDIVWPTKP
jgi:hypothetical protein